MKTSLVLIDIQNDYFDKGSMTLEGADKASVNAQLILDKFRSEGLPVIHIQHITASPAATFFCPTLLGLKYMIKQSQLGMFGFTCTVIGDACATKNMEINGQMVKAIDVQNSFLAALNYFYSTVVTTKDYLDRIKATL